MFLDKTGDHDVCFWVSGVRAPPIGAIMWRFSAWVCIIKKLLFLTVLQRIPHSFTSEKDRNNWHGYDLRVVVVCRPQRIGSENRSASFIRASGTNKMSDFDLSTSVEIIPLIFIPLYSCLRIFCGDSSSNSA